MSMNIDPSTLKGTLKALAEGIAKRENNEKLLDSEEEISIFKNCAQQLLDNNTAFDFTQEDLNKALGLEIHSDEEEVKPVYGTPDPEPKPVYGTPDGE